MTKEQILSAIKETTPRIYARYEKKLVQMPIEVLMTLLERIVGITE